MSPYPAYLGFTQPSPWLGLAACVLLGLAVASRLFTDRAGRNLGSEMAVGLVAYMAVGHELMFGTSLGGVFGRFWPALLGPLSAGAGAGESLLAWHAVFRLFETLLCLFALGILLEGLACAPARARRLGAALFCGLAYPLFGHWVWGPGGWLARLGFIDFAGSGLIFAAAGVCGLCGALNYPLPRGREAAKLGLAAWLGAGRVVLFSCAAACATASQGGPALEVLFKLLAAGFCGWLGFYLVDLAYGRGEARLAALAGLPAALAGLAAGALTFSWLTACLLGFFCGVAAYFCLRFSRKSLQLPFSAALLSLLAAFGWLGCLAAGLWGEYPSGLAAGFWTVQALGALTGFVWFYGLSAAFFRYCGTKWPQGES